LTNELRYIYDHSRYLWVFNVRQTFASARLALRDVI